MQYTKKFLNVAKNSEHSSKYRGEFLTRNWRYCSNLRTLSTACFDFWPPNFFVGWGSVPRKRKIILVVPTYKKKKLGNIELGSRLGRFDPRK